jgi:hypothetical protein
MNEKTETDISGYYPLSLYNLMGLSDNYKKLLKRIAHLNEENQLSVETIGDIVELDIEKFSHCKGVGNLYINLLTKFKDDLPYLLHNIYLEEFKEPMPVQKMTLSQEQLQIPLNQLSISTQYQRLIKRMSSIIGDITTVQDIFNITPAYFLTLPAVGKKYVNELIELQRKLPNFLEEKAQKTVLLKDSYLIEFNEIDSILIEDIENYLWSLDEKKQDIALSRWGFNHSHEALEQIGIRYNLTRERIRQFETSINTNFLSFLTINSKTLWANIREKMTEYLTLLLPNLAQCFDSEKLFYEFIELCCQVERGSIREIVFTKINVKIINQLFCSNPSPISQDVIINELVSNYGYSKAAAINGINNLEKLEQLKITNEGIYPKNLGKKEAVAHALASEVNGLPWKDIARIINKNAYTKKLFDETRQPSSLSNSDYIYQCGHGTYRNLIFIDIEQFDIPNLMQQLLDYFKQNNLSALHLHDYYQSTKNQRANIEYFTLRYFVREYGEEYGLYFNGKSGSDSVNVEQNAKRFTQSDVIIKLLNESKVALTKQEIAERLRSKSTNHATFLMGSLVEEGKIVRVDKMVYTTPEKAFANLNTEAIMRVIQDIMKTSHEIVEADVFREYVNMELNLSYSKYIYIALVKMQLKELGWYRSNTLFSRKTIPYKSLLDICNQLCNPELSNNKNIEVLQQTVWITDAVANNTLQWWKHNLQK